MRLRFEGHSSFEEVDKIVHEIMSNISNDLPVEYGDIIFNVTIALRELLNNAVEHGNNMDIKKTIICELSCDERTLCIKITDQGLGFDISNVIDKLYTKPLDRQRRRGIFMVKNLGFIVESVGSQVIAKLNINRECENWGDECGCQYKR